MARRKRPPSLTVALRQALTNEVASSRCTAYELAERAGVDRSIVSRFMAGRRTITLETADRLAGMLGMQLSR